MCEQDGCLSQQWVNYLGIYTTVASTLAAIGVARLADRVKGRLKEAIIALLALAAVIFLFLSLISVGVFQFGSILYVQILVYILLILGNINFSAFNTSYHLTTAARDQPGGVQHAPRHGAGHGALLPRLGGRGGRLHLHLVQHRHGAGFLIL